MRAGPLDRRIMIQVKTLTQNDTGAEVESWVTFAEVFAQKTDLRGDELQRAQQLAAETTTRWRIRHFEGLRNDMRILSGGQVYEITGIAELGRRDGLEISSFARVQ